MKYMLLGTNGLPTAFYSDDVHSNIPKEAIEITDEQWLECINNSGHRAFVDGALTPYVVVKTFTELKTEKLSQLKTNFEAKALRPKVPTTLGFDVDGGYNDLQNFAIGKKHALPQVKDTLGNFHNVALADYDTIITAIEAFGIDLLQWKWTKEIEINAIIISPIVTEAEAIIAIDTVVIA